MAVTPIQPKLPHQTIYIPVSPALKHIKHGSAIVGTFRDDRIHCAYEGGIYSSISLEEKLTLACWRLSERSPSIAYASVHPEEVIAVGTIAWDPILRDWIVGTLTDEANALNWFGLLPQVGGSKDQLYRAVGLILSNGQNVPAIKVWMQAKNSIRDPIKAVITHARALG